MYAKKCLKEMCRTSLIQDRYHLLNAQDVVIRNPKWSKFGFLYLIIIMPEDIKEHEIENHIKFHIQFIIDFMLGLDLLGLVLIKKDVSFNKYSSNSGEDSLEGHSIIKIVPKYFTFIRNVIVFLLLVATINETLNYYDIIKTITIF